MAVDSSLDGTRRWPDRLATGEESDVMGLFGKKQSPPPPPVDRRKVARLLQLGMAETDAGDRDLHNDQTSPAFDKAKASFDRALGNATQDEKKAAFDALRRHGY